MSEKQRIVVALVALFLFPVDSICLADSDPAEVECLPELPHQQSLQENEISSIGTRGVPRDQVLIEIATGVW